MTTKMEGASGKAQSTSVAIGNHRETKKEAAQTADDRPRFDNVKQRPVFFPMSPDWFHLGSHCAPIARQVEPMQRPMGVYLGPFDGGTQSGGIQRATETITRVIRTSSAATYCTHNEANHNQPTPTYATIPFDAGRKGEDPDICRQLRNNRTTQQNDPKAKHTRKHHTDNTCHAIHKQEAHISDQPTGLIPDRGKNIHNTRQTRPAPNTNCRPCHVCILCKMNNLTPPQLKRRPFLSGIQQMCPS